MKCIICNRNDENRNVYCYYNGKFSNYVIHIKCLRRYYKKLGLRRKRWD